MHACTTTILFIPVQNQQHLHNRGQAHYHTCQQIWVASGTHTYVPPVCMYMCAYAVCTCVRMQCEYEAQHDVEGGVHVNETRMNEKSMM